MHTLTRDLRYALRTLAAAPGFTATAVLVLALGIGVNSAVFGVVNELLLRPLPGQRDGRLVGLYSKSTKPEGGYRAFSWPNYEDIRARRDVFDQVIAHDFTAVGIGDGDSTRRAFAAIVSSNYFSTLGVTFARGRGFSPDEERPGAGIAVAVVSDALRRRAGADVGTTVRINGRSFAVVGIAPAGFGGTTALVSPDLWLPTGVFDDLGGGFAREAERRRLADRSHHSLILLGRLKAGVALEAAALQASQLWRELEEAYPAENGDHTMVVARLPRTSISTNPQDDSELTTISVLLLSMSGLVLLIACLNLANMLLARGVSRRKEVAIRLAIGAGRRHVIRQLLTEAFVLATAGGAAGLLVAYWSIALLTASLVPLMPLVLTFDPAPDSRVLAATALACVLSTMVFGLGPALRLSRAEVIDDLKEHAGDPARGRGRLGILAPRHVLVVAQIGLSLALLIVGGLFTRGALAIGSIDPGFGLDRQLLVALDPSLGGYDEARSMALYGNVLERVRALPAVEAASVASAVPFGDFMEGRTVRRPGARSATEQRHAANYTIIGSDYFRTLGLPVLRGRDFTIAEEAAAGVRIAIVDEPLARRLWPGEDPIGQQIQMGEPAAGEPPQLFEIVGIVPGMRHDLFDRDAVAHLYLPHGSHGRAAMTLHVRTSAGGPDAEAALLRRVRLEIRAVDERLPVLSARTFTEQREASLLTWMVRTGARLFMTFGLLAALLALLGVYGVRAAAVARRTREIGIRMALGADRRQVLALVMREGVMLTAVGLALGLALAAVCARLVASVLFRVSPFDPWVFTAAPAVLALSALLASYVPARRAARVTPVEALRQ